MREGEAEKRKRKLSGISSYIGITTIMRAPPPRFHLNLMHESGFSRETEAIIYVSLLSYVPTIPCMKCSFKMDKAIFRGKIRFSYHLASGRWKFSRPMAQFCLNSPVPAPGMEEDLWGFYTQLWKRRETFYILTVTHVETFNGTNRSPLVIFAMFFNKFAI